MLLAIALAIAAGWHANGVLTVREPPRGATEPILSIALDPAVRVGWIRSSQFHVYETFSGCRNPAHVVVDVLVNGSKPPDRADEETATTPTGYVHGVLIDPLSQAGPVSVTESSAQFPQTWVTPKHAITRHTRLSYSGAPLPNWYLFGAPLRNWYPSSIMVGMAEASTARAVLVKLRFTANWVLARSSGTCFLRFPTVQVPQIDPVDPPSQTSNPPTPGRADVDVTSSGSEIVDAQSSIPAPTDPRIPEWTCRSTAVTGIADENTPTGGVSNCGGVAVFAEPGADKSAAFWLLIDGALIGVAAALFVESAVKFRWPPEAA